MMRSMKTRTPVRAAEESTRVVAIRHSSPVDLGESHFQRFPFFASEHDISRAVTPHYHDCFEIDLVTGGNGENVSKGKRLAISEGDLILGNQFESHAITFKTKLRVLSLKFDARILERPALPGADLEKTSLLDPFIARDSDFRRRFHFRNSDEAHSFLLIARSLLDEYERKAPLWERMVVSLLETLLTMIYREFTADRKKLGLPIGSADHPVFFDILEYVDAHFTEGIRVQDIVEHVGVSRSGLHHLFRQFTGLSFKNYLTAKRMQLAQNLLTTGKMPIASVAAACGYNDFSVFYRAFKKTTGKAPKDFRAN